MHNGARRSVTSDANVRERRLLGGAQRAIDRDERHPGRGLDETDAGDVVPERRPGGALAVRARRDPDELELERSRAGGRIASIARTPAPAMSTTPTATVSPSAMGTSPPPFSPELHHLGRRPAPATRAPRDLIPKNFDVSRTRRGGDGEAKRRRLGRFRVALSRGDPRLSKHTPRAMYGWERRGGDLPNRHAESITRDDVLAHLARTGDVLTGARARKDADDRDGAVRADDTEATGALAAPELGDPGHVRVLHVDRR